MARKKKQSDELSDELLDRLLEGEEGETLLDPGGLLERLSKRLMERALEAEMTDHLGYEKHDPEGRDGGNSRNGKSTKRIKTDRQEIDLEIPRDRDGSFDPKLIPKHQRRFAGFDEKILALYSRGMSTRKIQDMLQELYNVEVSPSLISTVTDAVLDEVRAWQQRPLEAVYPLVYLDAIHLKMREDGIVKPVAVYVALALTLEGKKELLGLWVGETEGAKFWLGVLTELKNRGVEDILIAAIDGLKGFPEAIASVFPQTQVQLCIVHMVRNSLRFVTWKERKKVARDLKEVYRAPTVEAAEDALERFKETWDEKYPLIARSWERHWPNLITFFDYPPELRKEIYTTNAVESLNAQLADVTKKKGAFPSRESILKVMYLAMMRVSKNWPRPVLDWHAALNQFANRFGDRVRI